MNFLWNVNKRNIYFWKCQPLLLLTLSGFLLWLKFLHRIGNVKTIVYIFYVIYRKGGPCMLICETVGVVLKVTEKDKLNLYRVVHQNCHIYSIYFSTYSVTISLDDPVYQNGVERRASMRHSQWMSNCGMRIISTWDIPNMT